MNLNLLIVLIFNIT